MLLTKNLNAFVSSNLLPEDEKIIALPGLVCESSIQVIAWIQTCRSKTYFSDPFLDALSVRSGAIRPITLSLNQVQWSSILTSEVSLSARTMVLIQDS